MSFLEGAQELYYRLKDNKPFCAGKIGNAELMCLYNFFYAQHIKQWPIAWNPVVEKEIYINAGVFPQTEEARVTFCNEIENAIKYIDVISPWNTGLGDFEKRFIKLHNENCTFVDLCALEPYYSGIPWTQHLKDKNVLVISPFVQSIQAQYQKRDIVWQNKLLPEFNLIPLYHPTSKAISSVTQNPFATWKEMVDSIREQMDKIDFDIALIGTGASSLPIAAYAKHLDKQAIHLGGPLQILFGIKGKRWDSNKTMQAFYNDAWIRPTEEETPQYCEKVEGGCYW